MAKVIEATNPHAAWATMSMRSVATIFLYGLAVGVLTYVAYLLLEKIIFDPILCRESTAILQCENAPSISAGTAMIVGSFVGLVLLVRHRVYRPILAILGVAVSLWGIFAITAALPMIVAFVCVSLLFALAYVVFSWLVQPTSLAVSLAAVTIVAVLARLTLG